MGRGGHVAPSAPRGLTRAALAQVAGQTRRPVRILSIDGGGIRGIIPAVILAELEQRTGKPVAELFDLVAGTSTGAIIALGLTMPDPQTGRPRYTATELVELYEGEGENIFHRSLLRRALSADGLFDPKYHRKGLDKVLDQYFAEGRLRDALTDVLVPAYDSEGRRPFFFRSARARSRPDRDFKLADVARAATAAPTYFSPAAITNRADGQSYSLIDGGVFANNPGMCAWADAERLGLGHDVLMLSLGTGAQTQPLDHEDIEGWGVAQWARPIMDVVFDGVSSTTDYHLAKLLDDRYLRMQTHLDQASDKMDNASPENIARLKREARETLDAHGPGFDAFIAALQPELAQPARRQKVLPGHPPHRQTAKTPPLSQL